MAPKSGPEGDAATTYMDGDVDSDALNQVSQASAIPAEDKAKPPSRRIVWRNVVLYTFLHVGALYGFYVALAHAKWTTLLWGK